MEKAQVKKSPCIWVMVADHHVARVLRKEGDHILPVAEIVPDASTETSMTNKGVGRVASSGGSSMRHKYEPHMNESGREGLAFTRKVAAWLDAEAGKGSFDRLVLAAAPRMLGELRKTMDKHVSARIVAEVSKDLTKTDEAGLRAELSKILWF